MKRGCLVFLFVVLCVAGIFVKPSTSTKESPVIVTSTIIPTSTTAPTDTTAPTATVSCTNEYYDVVVDTVAKLSEANGISSVDALITRYDSTVVPYGCGRNDALLDMTDYSVRIALGEKRTSFMSKNAEQHAIASQVSANEALKTIQEWHDE